MIVGYHTKKVLFFGVRNKYCTICAKGVSKSSTPAKHTCYKNWDGNSSAMESDIIVEGFKNSIQLYGVKYNKVIGDGDSNVYKCILDANPYDDITVQKIECKNHLLRNMCNKLRELAKESKYKDVYLRKKIGDKILRLRFGINCAIRFRKQEAHPFHEKIKSLRKYILNAPYHIFGQHDNCDSYYCKDEKVKEKNEVPLLLKSGLFYRLQEIVQTLADQSRSLIYDVSNNSAESFNSVIAKFIGGKRINFCKKKSYETRCNAAVLSYSTPFPRAKLHKVMYRSSPGKYSKLFDKKRSAARTATEKHRMKFRRTKLFSSTQVSGKDKNYGINAEKPDMDDKLFEEKKEAFFKNLQLSEEECKKIEADTKEQRDSALWMHERRKRLTASFFGQICNKLPYTSCGNTIKDILYRHFDNSSMKYGRMHEKDAIESIKQSLNIQVNPSGLFINPNVPYLGATPDGLIDDDGIVEIKCPSSCSNLTPEDAIKSKKIIFLKFDIKTNTIDINKRHKYFFQIQGQLQITNRSYCIFVLWTPLGTYTKKVQRDDNFWEKEMENKLKTFFFDCLTP